MKLTANLLPKKLIAKNSAVQGTLWTVLGYGFSQSLRVTNDLIPRRFLYPELFGLMTLLNTFVMGLWLLSNVGIGPNMIQNKRGDDPEFFIRPGHICSFFGIALTFPFYSSKRKRFRLFLQRTSTY